MQTVCFYLKTKIDLQDIARFAQAKMWKTEWITEPLYNRPGSRLYLNVMLNEKEHIWWQWYETTVGELWFEEEEEREILRKLEPKTILLLQ